MLKLKILYERIFGFSLVQFLCLSSHDPEFTTWSSFTGLKLKFKIELDTRSIFFARQIYENFIYYPIYINKLDIRKGIHVFKANSFLIT